MPQTVDQEGNATLVSPLHAYSVIDVTQPPRLFSVIAAVDLDGGYAKDGVIPWFYSEDLKWFKNRTENTICVMGRTTYQDICARLGDKALESVLPNRTCFVVSTTLKDIKNATVISSLGELEKHLSPDDPREVSVIGGGRLFREAVSKADVVFLTVINKTHECDSFFPVKYILNNFINTKFFKGKEEDLRYTVWQRTRRATAYQR